MSFVRRARARGALLVFSIIAAGSPALALTPEQVVVLYNTRSESSLRVANYYVLARHIPPENLIGLSCTTDDDMTPESYEQDIVERLVAILHERKLYTSVKCLVTTYGFPLRVGEAVIGPADRKEVLQDQRQLEGVLNQLVAAIGQYNAIAAASGIESLEPTSRPSGDKRTWQQIAQELNTAAKAAARRLSMLDDVSRPSHMRLLVEVQQRVAGISGLLASLRVRPNGPDSDREQLQLDAMQKRLTAIETEIAALNTHIYEAVPRQRMVVLRNESHGLIGQAMQLDEIIHFLTPQESYACLDNELALVLSDQSYPRSRWVINPNNVEFYPTMQRIAYIPRSVMVTRLDGSTVEKVQAMIDTSLRVEKTGLDGKLYLDARGLHGTDGYSVYDAEIRHAADWIRSNSTFPVVLDDNAALLQAKDAPDAALYCGWYSLRHYQDSCQWLPGAVGYHVASSEMATLHGINEQGWVVNLLDRGFCGTLGPVAEPYLNSFPKPSQFFPLLLSGEFTQGEVWEVTSPMLSWQQGYVGDPLYNPFHAKPRVKIETLKADVILRNAFTILRPSSTTSPADTAPTPTTSQAP